MTRFAIALMLAWMCGESALTGHCDGPLQITQGEGPPTNSATVPPAKARPQTEPIAPNLIGSLVHPTGDASIVGVHFSPAGDRLFAAGYPSGVVQIWDVATQKEICRIETPPGYRSTSRYFALSPDWTRIYVPVQEQSGTKLEKDGNVEYHVKYGGQIRIWDVAAGTEQEPLRPEARSAPLRGDLDPSGSFLVSVERPSYFSSAPQPPDIMVVWELATGKKLKLCDGWTHPSFFPDGKTVAMGITGRESKTATLRLFDLATAEEQTRVSFAANFPDRQFSLGPVSPDGTVLAVYLNNKGAPGEVWFLDGKTLEDRGKLVLEGDAKQSGWSSGVFTWDGKRFIALDRAGNAWIWDVARRKVDRTQAFGSNLKISASALSPDGKTLAVAWIPDFDIAQVNIAAPNPFDLPQPRVSLLTLDGSAPPQVLIAPHGGVSCSIAFSPDGKTLAFGNYGAVHLFDLMK